jgi:anti-sigma regulatory factor (Ser/Thr protein kinase)
MDFRGEASGPSNGFVHQALIYGSDDEFVDASLRFVEEAMALREPALVAAHERNLENLRDALGGTSAGVTLVSVEHWYETSARTRDKFDSWVVEQINGGRGRLIAEPPWSTGHGAQLRDWARHESVLNVAFADYPLTFLCPYDARVLPDEAIDHAQATHPEIVGVDGASASPNYENPRDFCRRLDAEVTRPTGDPSIETGFRLGDLPGVRRLIESTAIAAGMTDSRAEAAVLAVNEIATNALLHGRPPAALRLWIDEEELICEISDPGSGIDNVLAGQLPPSATQTSGRGLWMARQLCDAVEVRNSDGCTVTVRMKLPGDGAAG